MKISQLQQIITVSNCKSINKAASLLYISQSALATSIRTAEDELGQPVFIRSQRGITLTEYGEVFVKGAKEILSIYYGLTENASIRNPSELRVSSQFLRYAAAVFTEIYNSSQNTASPVRFAEKSPDQVCQDILDHTSDIGIIVIPTTSRTRVCRVLEENGVSVHIMDTSSAHCLVGRGNPLFEKPEDTLSLKDLSGYTLLHYEQKPWLWGKGTFEEEEEFFPHVNTFKISDSGSFQQMLALTSCYFIGIHSETAYQFTKFYKDIRILNFSDVDFTFDTIWVCMNDYKPSPLARAFLKKLYSVSGCDPKKIMQ